jgi:hypothetical protein
LRTVTAYSSSPRKNVRNWLRDCVFSIVRIGLS